MSLIGESWGGMVALKMAQILEAQGTLVTVSLLEGDPEFLTGWAGNFLSNDNVINKLNTMYGSMASQVNTKIVIVVDHESKYPKRNVNRRGFNVRTALSSNFVV